VNANTRVTTAIGVLRCGARQGLELGLGKLLLAAAAASASSLELLRESYEITIFTSLPSCCSVSISPIAYAAVATV